MIISSICVGSNKKAIMKRLLPPWSLYSWMLFYLWCAAKTLSLPHQLQNIQETHWNKGKASQDEYTDLETELEKVELRFWQQRHVMKRQSDSVCNESLQDALQSCQNSVNLNTSVMSDPNLNQSALLRTQFCGLSCRTKMFIHALQCTVRSFIVEISGDCKNRNEASCIYAAVIMVDGVLYCSVELDQGQMNSDETASSSLPTDLDNCSLSTSYSTDVKHRFLHDTQIGRQVLTPPLKPPWQNCSNFAFNNSASSATNSISSTVSPKASSPGSGTFSRIDASQGPSATTNGALRHYSQTYLTVCFSIVYLCCLILSKLHL